MRDAALIMNTCFHCSYCMCFCATDPHFQMASLVLLYIKAPKMCWWQKQNYEYGVWQVLQLVELCIHTVYNLDAAAALITNTWVFYCPCCTCYWSTSFMNSKLFFVMIGSESWWIFLDAQAFSLMLYNCFLTWIKCVAYKCYSPWQR